MSLVSESRKKLLELERSELYVFHGSGLRIDSLEPRQAHTIIDNVKVNDGEPAVFASNFIDYAIFMAVINHHNLKGGCRSSCSYTDPGGFEFGALQSTLDKLNPDTTGFVHVLDRKLFTMRGGSEWMSTEHNTPLDVIEVRWSDFTHPVSIIPDSIIIG